MKHRYSLVGATCQSCKEKVESDLLKIENVTSVVVSKDLKSVEVEMSKHVERHALDVHLQKSFDGKYSLEEYGMKNVSANLPDKSFKTYFPLILVVMYVLLGTTFGMYLAGDWTLNFGMSVFMGLFFLAFSFFKLLDIPGFAMSYMSYDIIAAKFPKWGFVYPFIEFGLGVWFMTGMKLMEASVITFVVMLVSLIGVVKAVLTKRKIQCACLGTGFNLPMSTVTIIEDGGMVLMAIWMIYTSF